MAKGVVSKSKIVFGKRKGGVAKRKRNKHESFKEYNKQGR